VIYVDAEIRAILTRTLLLPERKRLVSRVACRGMPVLACVLKAEFAEVRWAYEDAGMSLVASRMEKEWRHSGTFVFNCRRRVRSRGG
jgi:hypothetical protein